MSAMLDEITGLSPPKGARWVLLTANYVNTFVELR